jgi:hypothetical protein
MLAYIPAPWILWVICWYIFRFPEFPSFLSKKPMCCMCRKKLDLIRWFPVLSSGRWDSPESMKNSVKARVSGLRKPRPTYWTLLVTHRIHVCYIWWHRSHQYTPIMLAYIPYTDPMGTMLTLDLDGFVVFFAKFLWAFDGFLICKKGDFAPSQRIKPTTISGLNCSLKMCKSMQLRKTYARINPNNSTILWYCVAYFVAGLTLLVRCSIPNGADEVRCTKPFRCTRRVWQG